MIFLGVAMMATAKRWFVAVVAIAALSAFLFPGTVLGEDGVSLLGLAWTPEPAPALVVSATGPLVYQESRPAPGLVVVDFGNATLETEVSPVSRPAAGLQRAVLSREEGDGRSFARLRLEVGQGVQVTLAALPAGLEIRFAGPAGVPAQAGGGGAVSDLLAVADASGVSVLLAAGGPLEGKAFTLEDPPRVVLDLPGTINRVSRRVHPVEAVGVQRVRIAQFATEPEPVVRVVVDLERPMPYRFEKLASGGLLRVGGEVPAGQPAPEVAAAVAAPPPAPAVQQPVVTAEAPPPQPEPEAVTPAPQIAAVPTIVDKPLTEPAPQASAQVALAAPPPTTPEAQPAAAPASESPWTTTRQAMAEQAAPEGPIPGATKEVETQERRFTGEPISLVLKDADIKDVLRTFAKITGLNIVVDPDVTGSATVNLENVPWDQCLDIILRINRLDYVVENNVLRVARISRLTQEKQLMVDYKKQEEAAKPLRTVTKTLSYARADVVAKTLESERFILSSRGAVVVDTRTNQIIIRDGVDRIEGILNLVDSLDQPNPQVIIEARIVETTRSFSRALGVTWGFTGLGDAAHGTTTGLQFPNSYTVGGAVNLGVPATGVIGFTFADVLDAFNLDFTLSAAEQDGLVKLVSSPKVTAQNNQKAHIQSGLLIPVQTVANNTITITYTNATLSLDVTPQITAEGTVILDIDLRKREPLSGINVAEATRVPIVTRDASTILMVRDGGTTVIGGIFKSDDENNVQGIPGLSKLPIVGGLFRSKTNILKHDELLIFITPRILKY